MGKGYPAALVRDSERQCQNFAPEGRFGNSVFLDCGKGPVSKPAHPEKTVVVHEDDKKKKEEKTKHATETVTPLSGMYHDTKAPDYGPEAHFLDRRECSTGGHTGHPYQRPLLIDG